MEIKSINGETPIILKNGDGKGWWMSQTAFLFQSIGFVLSFFTLVTVLVTWGIMYSNDKRDTKEGLIAANKYIDRIDSLQQLNFDEHKMFYVMNWNFREYLEQQSKKKGNKFEYKEYSEIVKIIEKQNLEKFKVK